MARLYAGEAEAVVTSSALTWTSFCLSAHRASTLGMRATRYGSGQKAPASLAQVARSTTAAIADTFFSFSAHALLMVVETALTDFFSVSASRVAAASDHFKSSGSLEPMVDGRLCVACGRASDVMQLESPAAGSCNGRTRLRDLGG